MERSAADVLFIAGFGRSGSTLLDRIFGRIEGFVSVGEIRQLWRRGLMEGQLCGCGEPVPECGFWREVLEDAFRRFTPDDARRVFSIAHRVDRVRTFRALYRDRADDGDEYARILASLFRSVRRVSGARVIVDTSKSITHGLLLRKALGDRVSTVHLVRDSRAVAFSWMRRRRRPEIHWKRAEMPTFGALRTSLDWMLVNTLIGRARRRFDPGMTRIRYEDLAASPRETVIGMLADVGIPLPNDAEVPDRSFTPGIDHTVSGNPLRFQSATVEIRPDLEWQSALPAGKRRLTTALTWPLLLRYGYLGRE